jgi:hypothetical protein
MKATSIEEEESIIRRSCDTDKHVDGGGSGDGGVTVIVGVGEYGAEERQHEVDPAPDADALGRRRRAHPHDAGEVRHQVGGHPLVHEPLHARHHCHSTESHRRHLNKLPLNSTLTHLYVQEKGEKDYHL